MALTTYVKISMDGSRGNDRLGKHKCTCVYVYREEQYIHEYIFQQEQL